MSLLSRRRATRVAPDMSSYIGRTALGGAKIDARRWLGLLRSGGIGPDAPIAGETPLPTGEAVSLAGYRATEDPAALVCPLHAWASQSLSAGTPALLRVQLVDGTLRCSYSGMGAAMLLRTLPGAGCQGPLEACRRPALSEIVCGIPCRRVDYDSIFEVVAGCEVCIEAVCLPDSTAAAKLDQISSLRARFEPYRLSPVSGAGGDPAVVREVADLLALCDAVEESLVSKPDRCRLLFRVWAECAGDLERAVSALMGDCALSVSNPWLAPFSRSDVISDGCIPLQSGGVPFGCECALEDAVLALMPPQDSHAGFTVSLSSMSSQRRGFPGVPRQVLAQVPSYDLGRCENDGSRCRFSMASAHSIVLTGQPGTGKTTAMHNILLAAHRAGVPILSIECSHKREVARLVPDIGNLEVLGIGPRGANSPFWFNPLAVPSGTQVAKHAEDFATALLLAADGDAEAPLPQAMRAIVGDAYSRAGWALSEVAYEDRSRPWPTIADLDPEAWAGTTGYELRVRMNVAQAVSTRVRSLMTYRDVLCGKRELALGRLVRGSVDLELGVMGERSAAFLATCVLRSVLEWASTLPDRVPDEPPRLMVAVDELRGLLALEGTDRPITELLVRAFSQVCRAKGVTLVVASQTPRDCSDIVANAAAKVAFRSDHADDTEAISSAYGLEEWQRRLVGTLPNHHAVAKLEGDQPVPIATDAFEGAPATALHAACIACGARVACRRVRPMAEKAVGGVSTKDVERACERARFAGMGPATLPELRRLVLSVSGEMPLEAVDCAVGQVLAHGGVGFGEARNYLVRYGKGE